MFSFQSSLQAFKVYFRHDLFPPNDGIPPSSLSLPNIINFFDISFLAKSILLYHQIHNSVFESSFQMGPLVWLFPSIMSGIEVLAHSLNANYYAATAPFLEPLSFWLYSQRQILHNSSSAPSWTQGPLLNFLVKCINF